MTDFVEERFPIDIAYGVTGGAGFSTEISETFGGHEQRNINWSQSRGVWNVGHAVKSLTQMDALIAFFYSMRGRAIGFRFRDWLDFRGVGQNLGTGDGSTATFQIRKQYTTGSVTHNRIINKIVSDSDVTSIASSVQASYTPYPLTVYVDAVEKTETTHYTVDRDTGIITFTGGNIPAIGEVVTADYEFDIPVRFDIDQMQFSALDFNLRSWLNIPVIEIRV